MISIVIPVKNSESTIEECLSSVFGNTYKDFEAIIVDDGCTDSSLDKAKGFNIRVIKSEGSGGISNARNTGAKVARGDIILFIDADIIIDKNTLSKIANKFERGDIAAVVGILDEKMRYENFYSQYKNLWMRYTFNILPDNISLLYTSIAAVRRDIFLVIGGFDTNYKFPNVEDNEIGRRLVEAGHRIILDRSIEVKHIKKYTLLSLIKTHYHRTTGLVKLVLRNRIHNFLKKNYTSVPNSFIINIPLSAFLAFFAFLSILKPKPPSIFFTGLVAIVIIVINNNWLRYIKKVKGLGFCIRGGSFLFIELIMLDIFIVVGLIEYFIGKKY